MDRTKPYAINLDLKYGPLEAFDADAVAGAAKDDWFNQSLCRVNDCVVRLGAFKGGRFHWHKHDDEDELFFVLSGRLVVEHGTSRVELGPRHGIVVPRGVMHRTSAPEPTVILMMEGAGVEPTGD